MIEYDNYNISIGLIYFYSFVLVPPPQCPVTGGRSCTNFSKLASAYRKETDPDGLTNTGSAMNDLAPDVKRAMRLSAERCLRYDLTNSSPKRRL